MALIVKDRVKETTTTTGTTDFTLGGASAGFQTFAVIGNTNTTYYAAVDQATGAWEVGIGTYSTTGPTLTRDTVLESSNSGSKVVFAAGSKEVFCTYPAERSVYLSEAGSSVSALNIATLGATTANITTATITAGTVSTTPTNGTDLANKAYVDTMVSSGIHFHQPVRVESPINLNATYNNGTAGVGATLTNAGTQAALVIDGVTVAVNDRVLVYQQTTQTQNGIYVVTNTGSGSTNWVLTRSSDANTYAAASATALGEGSAVFVQAGTTGAGETYVCNTPGTITFGTTNITFAQVSSAQIYSAGTGLTLSGTQFSITPVGTAGTYGSASSVPVFVTNAQGQVTSVTNTAIAITSAAVSGLAASATTDTTNAANITSGTLPSARLSGSYTGITGVGTLTAGTWNATAIGATFGGTGQTSYVQGDLLYAASSTTVGRLADVATGNALISGGVGGDPAWGKIGLDTHVSGTLPVANGGTGATTAAAARTNLGATTLGGNLFTLANVAAISFPRFNADNTVSSLSAADFRTAIGVGTGTGTVTSVGGTGTVSGLSLSGTVTTSGNLTLSGTLAVLPSNFASQTANTVLAAPNGSTGAPTFRALVAADIPTLNQNTTGNAATATTANQIDGIEFRNGNQTNGVNPDSINDNGTGYVTTVSLFGQTDGALYSQAFSSVWVHQIFGDYRTGQLAVRGRNNGTLTAWRIQLDSSNYTSYSPTLTGGGASGSWGISVTGTSANVTGTVAVANGGTGATTAAAARTNLGATTLGGNLFTLANVAAISFPRFNADNTVSSLDAATFRTAIGAGSGTVTSVGGTGTVSGLTLTGTVTTSGNLTLGGTLAVTPSNFASQTANTFLAAPNGTAGVPTFRTIVAADVPTLNQNTTGSAATFTSTTQNSQFNSIGVGTAGSGTAGEIRATNNITAYFSSDRKFKENIQEITSAGSIVRAIGGKYFDWTDAYIAEHGGADGYFVQKADFGVIAQDVQRVFPRAVRTRPDGSLAVDYEKLGVLAFPALVETMDRLDTLEALVAQLTKGTAS